MKKIALSLIFVSCSSFAQAQNLWQVFQLAHQNAAYNQANLQTQYAANNLYRSSASTLLPQVSASADFIAGKYDSGAAHSTYRAQVYTGTVTQQIFEPSLWMSVSESANTSDSATAQYQYQFQGFIQDVIKRYFLVLEAKKSLDTASSKALYLKRVFEESKAQFKVGVAAVTAVRQAEASYKEAEAEQLAAQNTLQDAQISLKALTNTAVTSLAPLKNNIPFVMPRPQNVADWVALGVAKNQKLIATRFTTQASKDALDERVSDLMPAISLVGTVTKTKNTATSAIATASGLSEGLNRTLALNLTWNLFTGPSALSANGASGYSISQGASLYASAQFNGLQVLRDTKSAIRQDYANVQTDVAKIAQYRAAVAASEAAVKQYQAMFKVGTGTMTNYLQQVSTLYASKESLYTSEYAFINDDVQLRIDAGTLSIAQIQQFNAWLS